MILRNLNPPRLCNGTRLSCYYITRRAPGLLGRRVSEKGKFPHTTDYFMLSGRVESVILRTQVKISQGKSRKRPIESKKAGSPEDRAISGVRKKPCRPHELPALGNITNLGEFKYIEVSVEGTAAIDPAYNQDLGSRAFLPLLTRIHLDVRLD
ncbi:hypothetical protein EVAR_84314_1 [Eumeta japonica]|uniref:Uncharacterized protein n=1 Tax=Eumeta variegata TaxID=151549 RepID=A0A4C1U4F7_EUMVA|nr:hypothetical protein EVAR_84314_1 [Eumeta japonica]